MFTTFDPVTSTNLAKGNNDVFRKMFITALFYYKKKRKSKYPSKNLKLWTFTKWTRSPLMTCENAHEIIKIHNYDNNAIYLCSLSHIPVVREHQHKRGGQNGLPQNANKGFSGP